MFLFLSALILTSTRTEPPAPEIAYAARFFAEGWKQSYTHIYLSRVDGTHRRQLTFGKRSHFGAVWVDRNHLAWSEFDGPAGESMDENKVHNVSFVLMNLATGHKKVVGRIQTKDPIARPSRVGRELFFGTVAGRYSDYTSFEVTTKRIIPGKHDYPWQEIEEREGTEAGLTFWAGEVSVPGSKMPYTFKYGPWKEEQESFEVTFDRKGVVKKFTLLGDDLKSVIPDRDGSLLATTGKSFNKFDNGQFLYRIDFAKGRSATVLKDFGNITLAPDNAHWAGNQAETRPLAPLLKNGKPMNHRVWVNRLYAGNWKTGRTYTLADGVVNVASFQFRPNK